MKMKRFFAPDMRRAMLMVKESLGAEAVILSNRKVNGGLEVVAAVDFENGATAQAPAAAPMAAAPAPVAKAPTESSEGLTLTPNAALIKQLTEDKLKLKAQASEEPQRQEPHLAPDDVRPRKRRGAAADKGAMEWAEDPAISGLRDEMQCMRILLEQRMSSLSWSEKQQHTPIHAMLLKRLTEMGLSAPICNHLVGQVPGHFDPQTAWKGVLKLLARQLGSAEEDIIEQGGVVALVGPTGVGKTTTIAKLASRYVLRHGAESLALITTDSYRIAAHEQLRTYGKILGVPVRVVENPEQLDEALLRFKDKRLVLIDTAGMGQKDERLSQQLRLLRQHATVLRNYLVLSATGQRQVLEQAARTFDAAGLDGCILTKVDECMSLGEAMSVVLDYQLPIAYFTDGQRVPEDIRQVQPHQVVNEALALMKAYRQEAPSRYLAQQFAPIGATA